MPASLVGSQFADLEPPGGDENAITLDAPQVRGGTRCRRDGFIERRKVR